MSPTNGMNSSYVSYFPIEQYVDKIKLTDNVLMHVEETSKDFDDYLKLLNRYDSDDVISYLLDQQNKEIINSNFIERHRIENSVLTNENIYFPSSQITHQKIKYLHKLVTGDDELKDYRTVPVRVSAMTHSGEKIFWRGVNEEDVGKFMDDFLEIYKVRSLSAISNNPFLKSALVHFIFVRIHPFTDGNGRSARIIHNIRFTESINRICGTNFKLCPLNLSQSILLNKITYAGVINNVYFDLEHDFNEEINLWFDFILNMVDEQIYNKTNLIKDSHAFSDMVSDIKKEYPKETIYGFTKAKRKEDKKGSVLKTAKGSD